MSIQQMFDDIAPTYDKLNRWLSLSSDHTWRARAIAAIAPRLTLRVLDLCAGTLDMTAELLKHHPHAEVTCVDFSQPMLDLGLAKIPTALQSRVTMTCEDALNLSLPDASVDVVVCAFGIRNLPDQIKALTEIHRVLTPDGQFIIIEFFQPTTWSSRLFTKTYGKYVVPWLGGKISHNPEAYEYLHKSTKAFYPLAAYRALLTMHGFHVEKTANLSGGIANLVNARKILRYAQDDTHSRRDS
jgi:demethylmenaquinone methyltransferase / 2-methoxy-6-polyprenyl-1,4-benzoquinol methylase